MAAVIVGKSCVFGIAPILPLKGFPEGRVRIRLRSDDWALAYIKTKAGIRVFYMEEHGGFWVPSVEKGRNLSLGSTIASTRWKGFCRRLSEFVGFAPRCDHRFDPRDMENHREVDGTIKWPCWKCGELFSEECGLDILSSGAPEKRPGREGPLW